MEVLTILAIVVIMTVVVTVWLCAHNSKSDLSLSDHQRIGRYRVLYKDGSLSQNLLYETACSYARIFNGKVVPYNYQAHIRS